MKVRFLVLDDVIAGSVLAQAADFEGDIQLPFVAQEKLQNFNGVRPLKDAAVHRFVSRQN